MNEANLDEYLADVVEAGTLYDELGLWALDWEVKQARPDLSLPARQAVVLRAVERALGSGLVVAGEPEFEPLRVDAALETLATTLDASVPRFTGFYLRPDPDGPLQPLDTRTGELGSEAMAAHLMHARGAIDIGNLVRTVIDSHHADERAAADAVRKFTEKLVRSRSWSLGRLCFHRWHSSPAETVRRIKAEWNVLGRELRTGDIVWFTAPTRAQ